MSNAFEVAAAATVSDYQGGARELATLIGMNYSVLLHKVCLTDRNNQFTVPQVRKIMLATGDYRMLHGLATDLDHLCIQVEGSGCGQPLERTIAAVAKEFGEYLSAVSLAVSDDEVTPNEMKRIDRELSELVASANQLRAKCAMQMRSTKGRRRG